jgi:hypothetical protein
MRVLLLPVSAERSPRNRRYAIAVLVAILNGFEVPKLTDKFNDARVRVALFSSLSLGSQSRTPGAKLVTDLEELRVHGSRIRLWNKIQPHRMDSGVTFTELTYFIESFSITQHIAAFMGPYLHWVRRLIIVHLNFRGG